MPDEQVVPSPWSADWKRIVYNALFRFTGDRRLAKEVARRLAGEATSPTATLLRAATTCLAEHGLTRKDSYRFAPGRSIVERPLGPDLAGLFRNPAELRPIHREIKGYLAPAHLGVLELLFVDRIPVTDVAEFLGLSVETLESWLANLLDHLAGWIEAGVHRHPDCPHLVRWLHRLLEEPGRGPDPGSCEACEIVWTTLKGLASILALDSRILSLGDRSMTAPRPAIVLARSEPAPGRAPGPGIAVKPPSRARSGPGSVFRSGALLAGLAAAIATPFLDAGRSMRRISGLDLPDPGGESVVVGRLVGADSTDRRALMSGRAICVPAGRSARFELEAGGRGCLEDGGRLEVLREGLVLTGGRLELTCDPPRRRPLLVRAGEHEGRILAGRVEVRIDPAGRPSFRVMEGLVEIVDPANSRTRLPAGAVHPPPDPF